MPKKTPQNPTEALAAKLAAEGVIEIESRLYSILAPALAAQRQAAQVAVAGAQGPKRRVLLINNGDAPVFLAFELQELRPNAVTGTAFLLPVGVQPLALLLQPGQALWARSSTGAEQRVSVATSVAAT